MSNKKNIDRLFQERFKHFEAKPDPSVWENIEARLDGKKKKRRVFPIWWKLGGIAAVLAILVTIGLVNYRNTEDSALPTEVVNTESNPQKDVQTEKNSVKENLESTQPFLNPENAEGQGAVVSSESTEKVSSEKEKRKPNPVISGREIASKNNPSEEKQVQLTETQRISTEKNPTAGNALNTGKNNAMVSNQTSAEKEKLNDPLATKTDAFNNVATKDERVATVEDDGKKSLLEIVAQQEQEEKEKLLKEPGKKRWSISPTLAPVYYNTLGNGSPIHSQFAENSKSGEVNMSYGVYVDYAVSKKLSIRSGVNRVNYGYSTNNVEFTSSIAAQSLPTIKYAPSARSIEVAGNIISASGVQASETTLENTVFEGAMNQRLGYVEVPLEVKYRMLDKKLGVNLIGGVSSLLLTNNDITLESSGLVTEMGEANNLNSFNISTNIGLGVDYQMTDKLRLNVEPMFKYQLNTFSNDAGGFRPYSLGVYTGFSFRF